jgi:hypothetical protein
MTQFLINLPYFRYISDRWNLFRAISVAERKLKDRG